MVSLLREEETLEIGYVLPRRPGERLRHGDRTSAEDYALNHLGQERIRTVMKITHPLCGC